MSSQFPNRFQRRAAKRHGIHIVPPAALKDDAGNPIMPTDWRIHNTGFLVADLTFIERVRLLFGRDLRVTTSHLVNERVEVMRSELSREVL